MKAGQNALESVDDGVYSKTMEETNVIQDSVSGAREVCSGGGVRRRPGVGHGEWRGMLWDQWESSPPS